MVDTSKLNFFPVANQDKVVASDSFIYSLAAATLSGGIYLPKIDQVDLANPYGQKALLTLAWSIDGTNFYPGKPFIYNPGNPVQEGVGASVGGSVDDDYMYFYFIHYLGVQVDFTVKWVLDTIT